MGFEKIASEANSQWNQLQNSGEPLILVGTATCGRSAGALETISSLNSEISKHNLKCNIIEVGCNGLCYVEPIVCIQKPDQAAVCYGNINSKEAVELVNGHLINDTPALEYALGTIGDKTIDGIPDLFDTPGLKPQVRRVLKNCGVINPENLNHYIANNGYHGLHKSLSLSPQAVINEVKESGLRGRGGAGYPTWRKWQFCKDTKSDEKYLVCNADEGDPGAFMNRSLLEGDPHSLIEGMIISGYAIGAGIGYIYCRAEYPLALERLRIALSQAEEYGFLGDNILDSGFNFKIKIKEGAGAFVCGEETALIASIEGKRGMPRPRPPFPAVAGLWGKPTIINNVETLASVTRIFQHSAEWFAQCGSENSKGTKTFALVGKVKNTGLIEVPLGITLREIIFDIGGGVVNDGKFKAVQTGGPSGGRVPAELLDMPVDFDSLAEAGTIMGSGGMVVMDEDTCMVDIARYFLDFAEKESCGECVPCRLGTKQLLLILEKIADGEGSLEDIDLLIEISEGVKLGSLCGLGQTAPNPVLSTIRYFRSEYEEHIKNKRCPSKVCKKLISYRILAEKCIGCGLCLKACPTGAITGESKDIHLIDQSKCIMCGLCFEKCPPKTNAVECLPGSITDRGAN